MTVMGWDLWSSIIAAARRVITYLLRTDFSAVAGQPVTLTDGQVLDTAGEGMVDGSGTVVDLSTGTVSINSNALQVVGSSQWDKTGVHFEGRTRASGLILKATINNAVATINGTIVGFALEPTIAITTNKVKESFNASQNASVGLAVYTGTANIKVGDSLVSGTDYELAIVIDATGGLYLIKGGAYTSWTLLWVDAVQNAATLYPILTTHSDTTDLSALKIPETLYPDLLTPLVQDTFTDADGTLLPSHTPEVGGAWSVLDGTFEIQTNKAELTATGPAGYQETAIIDAGSSDVLMKAAATRGSGNVGFKLRWTGGTGWAVVVNAANEIQLYEYGGSFVLRGSGTVTYADGEDLLVIAEGQTIKVYYDNVLKITYASATLNETVTTHGLSAAATGAKWDNFTIHPRTSETYDTILDGI